MTPASGPLILLDVGSTNTRAWLVREGVVLERLTALVGVRDTATTGSNDRLRETVAGLIAGLSRELPPAGVAAAGMITSAQGLLEVAHVPAPVSAADLARAATMLDDPSIAPVPMLLVPGVRTPGDAAALTADVMRGEETLVVGLLADGRLAPGERLLNAGSHWKLIDTDRDRRIVRSRTTLGGEVVHAVQTGTLLSASLPSGPLDEPDPVWLAAGAAAAADAGVFRALFAVRLLDQRAEATPSQRHAWLVGACIGDDIRGLRQSGALDGSAGIAISGPGAIPRAWHFLLTRAGCTARALDAAAVESAYIAGLLAIHAAARPEDRS